LREIKAHIRKTRGYGRWGEVFETQEISFSQDTAEKYMSIAKNPILKDSAHARNLPPCREALYLLSRLPVAELKKMLADGRVHRDTKRKDVEAIKQKLKAASPLGSLIAKLETVQPAIALNPLIPLLQHYWFTGKQLLAYTGIIGIQVPFTSDFAGAVPKGVLDLLKAAGFSGEVKLTSENDRLLVSDPKTGGVLIKLKMLEPRFPFKIPQHKQTNSNPQAIAELVDAIRYCLISVGADTSIPECLGITLERDGKRITLYSSDSSVISRISISELPLETRATLPSSFCKQMVRLYDDRDEDSEVAFEIGGTLKDGKIERHALFTAGGVTLYGRIIESRIPYDFKGIVAQHLPKGYEKRLVDIPERLRKAVALASVVCNEKRRQTKISVSAGQLCLVSKDNDAGVEEVKEVMPVACTHGDVTVTLEPKQLRHISDFDKMLVTTNCIIMTKTAGNELHLVSCLPPRE
jgi:DNA polymerase III sliding clamp (beta) subunit (PCNA family)